jgi:hypothetical protein
LVIVPQIQLLPPVIKYFAVLISSPLSFGTGFVKEAFYRPLPALKVGAEFPQA